MIKLNQVNIHMSKHLITTLILALLVLSSCSSGDPEPPMEPSIEEEFDIPFGVKEPLALEYMIHDVEGIVFNILYDLNERDNGEAATHETYNIFAGRGKCASQDLNPDNNRLILDFNNGCTDDFERYRQGQITIDYSDPNNTPGTIVDVTLTEYFINSISLNGNIRIENLSQTNSDATKTYRLSFSNLQLGIASENSTFSGVRNIHYEKVDGSQYETTTVSYSTSNELNYELSNGLEFQLENSTSALNAFDCWLNGLFLPLSGTQDIEGNNSQIQIDFATGGCNYSLYLSEGSNEKKLFELSQIL